MNWLFQLAALSAIVSTVMVILQWDAVHALLYLILSLLSVAVIFFTLGAPFVAALEVIIYAGAIMVLFIFVVMMLNLGPRAQDQERRFMEGSFWAGPAVLALLLVAELTYILAHPGSRLVMTRVVDPKQVGIALFGPYLIGVELASLLLLAGLVGAYHLGRPHGQAEQEEEAP